MPRPAFPAPSLISRRNVRASLGRFTSREGEGASHRHCEERKRRSNPGFDATSLDCFTSLAMTPRPTIPVMTESEIAIGYLKIESVHV